MPGRRQVPTRFFPGPHQDQRRDDHVDSIAKALQGNPYVYGTILQNIALPGLRGRVRAVSGTSLTLWHPGDAANFATSQQVESAPTDGETGTKNAGSATVTGVDTTNGIITASAAWSTAIPGIAINDYLFGLSEFGPPVLAGLGLEWTSGALVLLHAPKTASGGVAVVRVRGPRFASVRTVSVLKGSQLSSILIESQNATVADLLIW